MTDNPENKNTQVNHPDTVQGTTSYTVNSDHTYIYPNVLPNAEKPSGWTGSSQESNLSDTIEHLSHNFKIVRSGKKVKMTGIALAQGVWKGKLYPKHEIKLSAGKLKGCNVDVEHGWDPAWGKGNVGKVTSDRWDPVLGALIFEADITNTIMGQQLLNKEWKGVSVQVKYQPDMFEGQLSTKDYVFTKLTITKSPACDLCQVFDVGVENLACHNPNTPPVEEEKKEDNLNKIADKVGFSIEGEPTPENMEILKQKIIEYQEKNPSATDILKKLETRLDAIDSKLIDQSTPPVVVDVPPEEDPTPEPIIETPPEDDPPIVEDDEIPDPQEGEVLETPNDTPEPDPVVVKSTEEPTPAPTPDPIPNPTPDPTPDPVPVVTPAPVVVTPTPVPDPTPVPAPVVPEEVIPTLQEMIDDPKRTDEERLDLAAQAMVEWAKRKQPEYEGSG